MLNCVWHTSDFQRETQKLLNSINIEAYQNDSLQIIGEMWDNLEIIRRWKHDHCI